MTPAVIPQVAQFRPHPGTPIRHDEARRARPGRTTPLLPVPPIDKTNTALMLTPETRLRALASVFRYVDQSHRLITAVRGGRQH